MITDPPTRPRSGSWMSTSTASPKLLNLIGSGKGSHSSWRLACWFTDSEFVIVKYTPITCFYVTWFDHRSLKKHDVGLGPHFCQLIDFIVQLLFGSVSLTLTLWQAMGQSKDAWVQSAQAKSKNAWLASQQAAFLAFKTSLLADQALFDATKLRTISCPYWLPACWKPMCFSVFLFSSWFISWLFLLFFCFLVFFLFFLLSHWLLTFSCWPPACW